VSGAAESKLTPPCEITGAKTKEPFAVGKFRGDGKSLCKGKKGHFPLDGEIYSLTKGILMGVLFFLSPFSSFSSHVGFILL
jgi:hypothetical protein